MNPTPLVTVAIPTYNRLQFLREAFNSVIEQTYHNIEIVISDNASTDGTREWLEGLNLPNLKVIFQHENIGMVRNWNECLTNASGTYFLLLSDDDLIGSSTVDSLVSVYQTCKDASIVYGKSTVFSKTEEILQLKEEKYPHKSLQNCPLLGIEGKKFVLDFFQGRILIYPCAILFRKQDLIESGHFSLDFQLATDAFAWIQIALNPMRSVYFCENTEIYYRTHVSSETKKVHKRLWVDEFNKLNTFFESNIDFDLINSDEYRRYLFRNKIREISNTEKKKWKQIIEVFKEYNVIKPPIKEIVFCLVLAIVPKSIRLRFEKLISRLR